MNAPIGWYVHHHGSGHAARLAAVAPHLKRDVVALTSIPEAMPDGVETLMLPLDHPRADEKLGPHPPFAHWAPEGVSGLRRRMAAIAAWIAEVDPALIVVDVSCEVAAFARLCGARVCLFRQQGEREDPPHQLARDASCGLLAPWPLWLDVNDPHREATDYTGCFSRFDNRERSPQRSPGADQRLTVVVGSGGTSLSTRLLSGWARCLAPGWSIDVVGSPIEDAEIDDLASRSLRLHGWIDDPWPLLCGADVVISHAGHNAVSEVAACGNPLIAVAEDRPFGEQAAKVRCLNASRTGVGLDSWPNPAELIYALESISRMPPQTGDLSDGLGAKRAAAYIEDLAANGRLKSPSAPPAREGSASSGAPDDLHQAPTRPTLALRTP